MGRVTGLGSGRLEKRVEIGCIRGGQVDDKRGKMDRSDRPEAPSFLGNRASGRVTGGISELSRASDDEMGLGSESEDWDLEARIGIWWRWRTDDLKKGMMAI